MASPICWGSSTRDSRTRSGASSRAICPWAKREWRTCRTEWGLFRHYWITVKFLLAAVGSLVLVTHMRVVSQMSGIARATSLTAGDFGGLRVQLVVHAVGGLLVLIAATVLSIYKPWGLTPYGRRKQEEKHGASRKSTPGSRRGLYLMLGIVGFVLVLLVLHHLLGGGPHHH